MSEHEADRLRILIRVSAAELIDARAQTHPLSAWFDRVDAVVVGSSPGATEPVAAAVHAAARHPDASWIVQGGFARDHPYNLARRVASLAALTRTGAGVLIESRADDDTGAESARRDEDGAAAMRELWQTWPLDSVIGDRETRTFVDASRILRANHEGRFRVTGPLQVPVDQEEQPVVLRRFSRYSEENPALLQADALLVSSDEFERARGRALPILREIDSAEFDGQIVERDGIAGVLLQGSAANVGVALRRFERLGAIPDSRRAGLRTRLGLGRPRFALAPAEPAFATAESR